MLHLPGHFEERKKYITLNPKNANDHFKFKSSLLKHDLMTPPTKAKKSGSSASHNSPKPGHPSYQILRSNLIIKRVTQD